ncbi:hypothetical protein CISIN_1g045648mg [Citrus sinensis]|uniref:Uncharacterized protein n=1 Tax=Citrus sinensis TaxID=2711 RepID=A0A067DIA9_CITSI|nr:hypothetical protein CISIN_1g045648mg [Citrus sinensis]
MKERASVIDGTLKFTAMKIEAKHISFCPSRLLHFISGVVVASLDRRRYRFISNVAGEEIDSVGTVDPVNVMSKWRKYWPADIILVGPTKEPEKPKEEPKKEEPKKREVAKKEEPKRIEGNPYLTTHYHVQSIEENPNACVIC